MDISFRTRKMQKTCSKDKEMKKRYGFDVSCKLQQRLIELKAARSLADISYLPPPRCHELNGTLAGHFTVDVKHPFRLLFVPDHDPVPRNKDGGIDRTNITAIEIIDIRDIHQ